MPAKWVWLPDIDDDDIAMTESAAALLAITDMPRLLMLYVAAAAPPAVCTTLSVNRPASVPYLHKPQTILHYITKTSQQSAPFSELTPWTLTATISSEHVFLLWAFFVTVYVFFGFMCQIKLSNITCILVFLQFGNLLCCQLTVPNCVSPNYNLVILASDKPWTALTTHAH